MTGYHLVHRFVIDFGNFSFSFCPRFYVSASVISKSSYFNCNVIADSEIEKIYITKMERQQDSLLVQLDQAVVTVVLSHFCFALRKD